MEGRVLVVGARGSVGRQVATRLREVGVPVRPAGRDEAPPAGAASRSADTASVRLDLSEPETFGPALEGVSKVFLYAHAAHAAEFCATARRAGVEHVVLLSSNSVLFPHAHENPTAAEHPAVEEALRGSGIAWTFVRPGYLATNTWRWRSSIREERTVRTAFPEGRTPLVHEQDVAEVAVAALLDDRHRYSSPLVLGGASLTEAEQVSTIAAALDDVVGLDVLSVEQYREELLTTVPEVFVDAILDSAGVVPQVPADVRVDSTRAVLGREPLTFAQWAGDHVEDFR